MSKLTRHKTIAALALGSAFLLVPEESRAANELKRYGAIAGTVSSSLGVPQMGATVLIYTRLDRLFGKAVTDDRGAFQFAGLSPDSYSVRVMLTTFVPALRRNILVEPGMRSMLHVNLSSLFSTIQLSLPTLENPAVMTDDWKWMLRGASVTRPVMRFADPAGTSGSGSGSGSGPDSSVRSAVFSETRGIVQVSAGEGTLSSGVGTEADLGTAFAMATSLAGKGSIQVSGNMGYGSQTGAPAAAFRTSYSRNMAGGNPEVSLTMQQLMLPLRLGAALTGNETALPLVRTLSVGFADRTQLSDDLTVQYGFTMDSVAFLERLNYLSPYVRMIYSTGPNGEIDFAYTSGNARPDLAAARSQDADLQGDLNSLGLFPRVALRDGRSTVQRGQEYEAGYTRKAGSRNFRVSAYREVVTNAALTMVAPAGMFGSGDVLPDLFSNTSTFNAGNFESAGYSAAATQNVGDHLGVTVIYGSTGGLTASEGQLSGDSADELRSMIHSGRRHTATGRVSGTLPKTGTHMIASYQWTADRRFAMPGNVYSTQDMRPQPGLNVYIRQPIPSPAVLPWRMEATADLRNLLAEGYLPIGTSGGQQVLLVETPRSFRGGVAFIF
jgi:hypothetical protein